MNVWLLIIGGVLMLATGGCIGYWACRIMHSRRYKEELREVRELHKTAGKYLREIRAIHLIQGALDSSKK